MSKRRECWVVFATGSPTRVFDHEKRAKEYLFDLRYGGSICRMVEHDAKLESLLNKLVKAYSRTGVTNGDILCASDEIAWHIKSRRAKR